MSQELVVKPKTEIAKQTPKKGSSEIWSDKLKRLYNKAHRATEKPEVKAISRRYRWHKERRRCSVQISGNSFGINTLYINC